MSTNPEEISSIIKEQIRAYHARAQMTETGTVVLVGDGIARVYGLGNCMANELLKFEDGSFGVAQNLETETVSAAILSDTNDIREGTQVYRTGEVLSVPVGEALLGRIVDALGQPIDGKGPIHTTQVFPIEAEAPGIIERQSVSVPLQTGIKAIDGMIPIGRGQRELIIGDRQTGKTEIAIDTIINQKNSDVICIYVAIGQKSTSVVQIANELAHYGAMENTIIVSASASQSAPLQYIAPYSGCAMAEYFRKQGKDVLIVYDDLSKHAVAYRALSLLIRRPPETELFHAGVMPAINPGISVSRVGGAAQLKAMKKVSGELKLLYSQYRELQAFAQFGSDLDADTKARLALGERIVEVLKQKRNSPVSAGCQVCILYAVVHGYLDHVEVSKVADYEQRLYEVMQTEHKQLLDRFEAGFFDKEDVKELEAALAAME